jgi:hypothetical protein
MEDKKFKQGEGDERKIRVNPRPDGKRILKSICFEHGCELLVSENTS